MRGGETRASHFFIQPAHRSEYRRCEALSRRKSCSMRFRSLLRSPSELAIWKDLAIDTHPVRSDLVFAVLTHRTPFRVLALSKHAALAAFFRVGVVGTACRSEEHTSELQSLRHL